MEITFPGIKGFHTGNKISYSHQCLHGRQKAPHFCMRGRVRWLKEWRQIALKLRFQLMAPVSLQKLLPTEGIQRRAQVGSQALLTNMSCSHCGVSHLSSTHWKSHVQGTSQRANLRWQCETQSLPMDIKYELPAAVAQSSPSNIWATGGKLFCQPREDKIHPSWQFSAVKTPKKKKKKNVQ